MEVVGTSSGQHLPPLLQRRPRQLEEFAQHLKDYAAPTRGAEAPGEQLQSSSQPIGTSYPVESQPLPLRKSAPQRSRRQRVAWATVVEELSSPSTSEAALNAGGAASKAAWARCDIPSAPSMPHGGSAAAMSLLSPEMDDDDVVLDTPLSLLVSSAHAHNTLPELKTPHHLPAPQEGEVANTQDPLHEHPASRGVGQDVIDLVTDAYTESREAAVQRRRRVLYELTHPNPKDYAYGGKLVPPPPLSFGEVTAEARSLGNEMMLGQTYSLVRQSGTRYTQDDVPGSGSTSTLLASHAGAGLAASIETDITHTMRKGGRQASRKGPLLTPYRSRSREANIFRDHNYFFEVQDLYQEVVLVGKACAGKSSLLNALLGQVVAKTSSTPNTTRKISFYQSVTPEQLQKFHEQEHHQLVKLPGGGLQLTFVDMPGYGIHGMSDKWRDAAIELTDAYFGVRRSVNTVLYCIDCNSGLTKTDLRYFQWLENVQGLFYIVLTKCDDVPHSRICSVMRQVYNLITKNRRKYRKVFPFIIPTSAKDGTNIEMLRGLITETSGMMPGDRLRDLLKAKKEEVTRSALLEESARLHEVRKLERDGARAYFAEMYCQATRKIRGTSRAESRSALTSASSASPRGSFVEDGVLCSPLLSTAVRTGRPPPQERTAGPAPVPESDRGGLQRHYAIPLRPSSELASRGAEEGGSATAAASSSSVMWNGGDEAFTHFPPDGTSNLRSGDLWKKYLRGADNSEAAPASPYFRLNTGLEDLPVQQVYLSYHDLTAGDHNNNKEETELCSPAGKDTNALPELPPSASSSHARGGSRVIGVNATAPGVTPASSFSPSLAGTLASRETGCVTPFLDTLASYHRKRDPVMSAEQRRKEEVWRRRGQRSGGLLVESSGGRLAPFQAGRPSGPSLVTPQTRVATRKAEWRAAQLKTLLMKENPEAPWAALHRLQEKIQAQEEEATLGSMTKKAKAAYLRDAGRVTESFAKFEGEVTAAKYMNETRQAKTLRSQAQMHLNATSRINYRSMPPGLWKRYGEKDTYWPTPRVLGRESDESHQKGA